MRRGAFTGAQDARKGYFEVTNGGTIFLDEIGEMPLGTQARLLRVLEYGEFIKVGSSKVLKTDVRVVAATNINLLEAVSKGRFREDLYYRLSQVPIYVPPLRERGNDIELLFRKFAIDFSERYHRKPIQLTPEAREILMKYRFPGNIRELRNLVDRMSVMLDDRLIDAETMIEYLPQERNSLPALYNRSQESNNFSERDLLYKVLFEMRHDMNELKKLVLQFLKHENHGNSIIEQHPELFNNVEDRSNHEEPLDNKFNGNAYFLNQRNNTPPHKTEEEPDNTYDFDNVEDITHETESSNELSLEKKEKELILKALRKNGNKRKYAAQDLGISERTLYRKIKQYEIE